VRSGAEVDELAVLEAGDLLAFRNFVDEVELEDAGIARTLAQAAEAAALRHGLGFLAADALPFELLVLLRDLFHLRLDLLEVIRRDAVLRQVEVVVEAVFHRRAVGKLGIRPQAQDGGGHHMGTGVAQAVDVGHLGAFFESFSFGGHGCEGGGVHGRTCVHAAGRRRSFDSGGISSLRTPEGMCVRLSIRLFAFGGN
jgi:hypothetical protein